VTKDNQRQGMSELLAKQRAGPPITPAEAARERRSSRRGSARDSADTGPPDDRPVAGSQPPEGLPPAEEALGEERQATRDQPGEIAEAAAPEAHVKARMRVKASRVAARARGRAAGRARSAQSVGRAGQVKDHTPAAAGNVNQAVPEPVRRAVAWAASNKGTLLAAACAVAVPVVCWLVARQRRQEIVLAAKAKVGPRLRDRAGEVTGKMGRRAAGAARSAWPARRR
jgi:hypothetical protein